MDFTGIIAEYDPFHNGHAAQLAAVRAAGAQCIAVCMSSGAVQRGGVPILPESVRQTNYFIRNRFKFSCHAR